MEIYDVIVVGAGIIGSATAYALRKRGIKTLLIDQFPLPHSRGSSHGASRITRIAYPEKFNTDIMEKAFPMWKQLEEESGMHLFKEKGLLCISVTHLSDLAKYHKNTEDQCQKPVPMWNKNELKKNYPLMSFNDENYSGFLDESAGILYSDKCLPAFQRVYLQHKGEIKDNCHVQNIIPGDIIQLETSSGVLQARGIVLTCGAWASKILEMLHVTLPLQPQAIEVCYWKTKDGSDHSNLPSLIDLKDTCMFGLPTSEYPGLMKICLDGGLECDPDCRDLVDKNGEASNLAIVENYVTKMFPHLHPKPAIRERCMYTMTPDENCIIDCHPDHNNIVYAAGFSGMGFKQAPVIGQILADLVNGSEHELLVDELRFKRFNS